MGWIAAAERHGETVPGFDLGNSPQDFTKESVNGKKIAITTTNGTRALQMCEAAKAVFVGSFLNLSQLTNELQHRGDDLLLFCAGWKDKFNLEDTLFAGAVATELSAEFDIFDDATLAAIDLYNSAKNDLNKYLQKASHVKRFKSLHIESDLDVCLKIDSAPVLPVFKNGVIVQMNNEQTA
jgi:2-phosphosulfolactate phosphatase